MNKPNEHHVDYQGIENFFNNGNLFRFIWKWKWVFSISAVIALILAVIFSGPRFITPKFKSETILYPINLNEYGDESMTEQMLQMLQSNDLKLKLVDAFNLYEHYKINPDDQYAQTYMFNELNDHVSFSKTSYESVRVSILDKDPIIAAAIADSINIYYNQLVKSLQDLRTIERVQRGEKEMNKITIENDSLKVKLKDLRKTVNLINPKKQTREITEAYLKKSNQADKLYKNLVEYRDEIIFLDSLVSFNNSRYLEYKDDHDEHVTELGRKLTYSSVISKPIPADKKSYPIRWLILAGSLIASIIICFVVLIIIENVRKPQN